MSFPEQPFGFVAGRWVRSIGDTPDDADRAPDYVPVETGTVVFTPQVTHRVAADGSGWAGIIKDRIPARLGERGQLIDAEGHDHLALAVGVYSVSYEFGSGRSWPSHYIEVRTTHTVDAPLWLPPIAPPPEGPMIENRVITIPDGGTDGQVLVWDGAGFSWDYPPEGPQGPPGEVTTAALTTALAGKVTGTGMTLQYDTQLGQRVFLTTPGGSVMIHGDTGWRRIHDLLINGWKSSSLRIRRINHTVEIQGRMDATEKTDDAFLELPRGFIFTAGSFTRTYGVTGGNLVLRAGGTLTSTATTAYIDMLEMWTTTDAWPSTLPGTPS